MKFTVGRKIGAGFAVILLLMIFSARLVHQKCLAIRDLEEHSLTVAVPSLQFSTSFAARFESDAIERARSRAGRS